MNRFTLELATGNIYKDWNEPIETSSYHHFLKHDSIIMWGNDKYDAKRRFNREHRYILFVIIGFLFCLLNAIFIVIKFDLNIYNYENEAIQYLTLLFMFFALFITFQITILKTYIRSRKKLNNYLRMIDFYYQLHAQLMKDSSSYLAYLGLCKQIDSEYIYEYLEIRKKVKKINNNA